MFVETGSHWNLELTGWLGNQLRPLAERLIHNYGGGGNGSQG